jgi:DNA polymerase-3 subunit epsilon
MPRFAVVDLETSGLRPGRDSVLQIGVVVVDSGGELFDRWSTLVRLRWPWSRVGPTHIHGLDRRTLRRAPAAAEALDGLAQRLDGSVFTAHNAGFDASFISRWASRHGRALDLEPRLCTLDLSRRLDPDRVMTHGLADVCARYGVTIDRHHDALADATATAAVLPHLLRANGVTAPVDLADLERLYFRRPTGEPTPAELRRTGT